MIIVKVHLGGPTRYMDYAPIPDRFSRDFSMAVFDAGEAGGELRHGTIAPEGANDCVSETIISHGVWEVPETILTLSAAGARPDGIVLDLGCQVGWFTMLALTSGRDVVAVDGNEGALELLRSWSGLNLHGISEARLTTVRDVIKPGWWAGSIVDPKQPIHIAKIDLEGAERSAIDGLESWWSEGRIEHILVEMSPVFNGSYPQITHRLLKAGYHGYVMPEKSRPPLRFERFPDDFENCLALHNMKPKVRREWIAAQHQFDVWFCRPGADWA